MGASSLQRIVLPAAIIVAGFAAIAFLSNAIAAARPSLPEGFEDTDLTVSGSRARGFAFGMEGLIADVYWMRALQYIGNKLLNTKTEDINIDDLRALNPRLLYPLLDNSTDLDPHFIAAYSYGAMVLPAIDPEKAIALASKGIKNNPNEWRLYQHLGYIYWRLGRYQQAAEIYSRGSQIAGSGPFMKLMAATMKDEGGSRETARAIYNEMLASSDDEQVRITAQRRLQQLDWMDEREAIDRALSEFKERSGRCANSFAEIIPQLMSSGLPNNRDFRVNRSNQLVDPTDAPYVLDKENCLVRLDPVRSHVTGAQQQ
jgi:tetratricopeptide (TPR) repeat protein